MASTETLTSGKKKSCGHLRKETLSGYRNRWLKRGLDEETRVFYGTEMDDALDELEAFT